MLFVLIVLVFILIAIIAVFGNTGEREIEKDKNKYKQITGHKYE